MARRIRREKLIRDFVRLEAAALFSLAREEKSVFCYDILTRVAPSERQIVKDELKKLEEILRSKVDCVDDA